MPDNRNYGQETRDTLQAQIDLAPQVFQAESSAQYGQPAYANLANQTMQTALMGGGGQLGMLGQYEQNIAPTMRRVEAANVAAQREGDVSDVERLGARASAAFDAADPKSQAIGDELQSQVMADLRSEGKLSRRERHSINQRSRQDYGSRGLLYSPASAMNEQYTEFMTEDAKRIRSQQQASGLWAQRRAQSLDPFMSILGRPSGAGQAGQGFLGQSQAQVAGAGPGLFNPESGYAQQMYNQQWQGQMQANLGSAANKAALMGGLMSMGGSMFKGRFGGGG
jgi:hypothetical protein